MTSLPNWLLDELSTAGRENLDPDHAAAYDSKEDSHALEELDLLKSLGLDGSSVLVEFGPGTGQLAQAAVAHVRRYVAVDISEVMLAVLANKTGASSNLEVVRGGFLTYEHRGPQPDFVYSRLALHHLPDFWKVMALSQIYNLLGPGGCFRLWDVVYNMDPHSTVRAVEAWCATGRDVDVGVAVEDGWGRWEIEEHVRDEHSTYTWLLEAMAERVGFEIEMAAYDDNGTMAKYVFRKRA